MEYYHSDTYYFYKLYYTWAEHEWAKGRYIKADGTIEHEGRWLKDSPVKEGEYTTSNMRIGEMGQYDGTIKDGKFHANGKYQERNMKGDIVYAYDGEYDDVHVLLKAAEAPWRLIGRLSPR
mgnify:CR=1 FL=1